jgi:phosphoribosylglycinamide formyltransferase-1
MPDIDPARRPICRVAVLISGNGSNLQSLLDGASANGAAFEVVAVISNRADAYGLIRARNAGVDTAVIEHRDFPSREAFDCSLADTLDGYRPDLVVLAGFMRILTAPFVSRFHGRLINIHPSLLPKYTGLHTHQRALDAGDNEAGCSVHFVTEQLDGGPVIVQARVPIITDDDAASLAQRVLREEHRIYLEAVQWCALGRVQLHQEHATLDGDPLPAQGLPPGKDLPGNDGHSETATSC